MGIFSWLRLRRSPRRPKQPRSLLRTRFDDPKLDEVKRAAAADVAEMEKDAKRSGRDE